MRHLGTRGQVSNLTTTYRKYEILPSPHGENDTRYQVYKVSPNAFKDWDV